MSQIGYDIVKSEIPKSQNHSYCHSTGTQVRKYQLQSENKWQIDLEDLKSDFLYVINPSNPCGSVFSKEHVQEIIDWANQNRVLIVADEIYYGMSFGEFGPIIRLGEMDKMFFTPVWQISWMIFYDKNHYAVEIKQAMYNICQFLLYANVFVINSLPQILDQLTIFYARDRMTHFKENHDFLIQELDQIRGLKCIPAQGTFYLTVLIDLEVFQVKSDTEFAKKLLGEENIILLPLSWNGTEKYQGFRMLTIATKDVYVEMIGRLKEFVKRL
ncbi:unnamed protein product (macronuclear) [Paramecium tetraurelia]|uniref:Chromosome undetermined scaffold_1, whole genome shotgun sequence n=1 Tax=Paramecium tetraurelia TaxID=5888 RepID=Q6BG48_PARTE|nr:Tyrosine aminotransferase [Paramecium tetraurelia strain d4-2]XP_001423311.1 uncharacterized protein GSPATT00000348001 [Paramecium tetraurelia]CAH03372.1 Tyrosine aminotransferase, putative [Paramecium tetraurelia]CAK55913.1 unnamed protein product [Paramecium tetraurelia]|eukprot:XP_001423311.1 hypothetical protein (macronuclear) [Paramecium tetraurelia strain d4-2]